MKHLPRHKNGDCIYVDTTLTLKKGKNKLVSKDISRKIVSKKDGLLRVLPVRIHTVTVDVNGTHNAMYIDPTTLARTAKEAILAAEEDC